MKLLRWWSEACFVIGVGLTVYACRDLPDYAIGLMPQVGLSASLAYLLTGNKPLVVGAALAIVGAFGMRART